MNKKAVFFDADGTVCDIEKRVPEGDTGQCCRGDYKTGEEWPSGMAVYRKKPGVCSGISGTDPFYRNDQRLWRHHRKKRPAAV